MPREALEYSQNGTQITTYWIVCMLYAHLFGGTSTVLFVARGYGLIGLLPGLAVAAIDVYYLVFFCRGGGNSDLPGE